MERVPLHKKLEPLAWLEGTWRTENPGNGKYPTIKDFNYYEEMSFESIGQPTFNYTARSFSNSELTKPMHKETGFLKITDTNKVYFLLAHNTGVVTMEKGEVTDKAICFNNTEILRMEGSKSPYVTQMRRTFELKGDYLEHVLYMATSNTPVLTEHLRARYVKANEEV